MSRAIMLGTDETHEVIELDMDGDDLLDRLEIERPDDIELLWLNGPFLPNAKHVVAGIACGGPLQALVSCGIPQLVEPTENGLASSLRGVFWSVAASVHPIFGPALVVGSDHEHNDVDVPEWAIHLVASIKFATNEALRHLQRPRLN